MNTNVEKAMSVVDKEISKEEAVDIANTDWWREVSLGEAARIQLHQDKLIMPFSKFHEGMEELLGRPVWTHEFAIPGLLQEELKTKVKPTFKEILEKIPSAVNN